MCNYPGLASGNQWCRQQCYNVCGVTHVVIVFQKIRLSENALFLFSFQLNFQRSDIFSTISSTTQPRRQKARFVFFLCLFVYRVVDRTLLFLLLNRAGVAGNPGPEVGALLGDGACDSRSCERTNGYRQSQGTDVYVSEHHHHCTKKLH